MSNFLTAHVYIKEINKAFDVHIVEENVLPKKIKGKESAVSIFPGYSLQIGSCGPAVETLQDMLNTLRKEYPIIPETPKTDGIYGHETRSAVRACQQVLGFPQTGIVENVFWEKISTIINQ